MTLTKFGHSCMLIEENGARILIDPGSYSDSQNTVQNIDAICISHEHQDHLDISSLRAILANNPNVTIYTNKGAGVVLEKEGISYTSFIAGGVVDIKGVRVEAIGDKHAVMYKTIPQTDNTGFLIGDRLWYPGDSFTMPGRPVEILALPMASPWNKLSESIEYALAVKPQICIPVHDGILKNPGVAHRIPPTILEPAGIQFIVPESGKTIHM